MCIRDRIENLGFADCKFISFTAHILDQDRQVKLTTSGYFKTIHIVCFFYAEADVSIPVSYTHLDVYKRQSQGISLSCGVSVL